MDKNKKLATAGAIAGGVGLVYLVSRTGSPAQTIAFKRACRCYVPGTDSFDDPEPGIDPIYDPEGNLVDVDLMPEGISTGLKEMAGETLATTIVVPASFGNVKNWQDLMGRTGWTGAILGIAQEIRTALTLADRQERGLTYVTPDSLSDETARRKAIGEMMGLLDPCGFMWDVHTGGVELSPEETLKLLQMAGAWYDVLGLPTASLNTVSALQDANEQARIKWLTETGGYRERRNYADISDWQMFRDAMTANPDKAEAIYQSWREFHALKYGAIEESRVCVPCSETAQYGANPANYPWDTALAAQLWLYEHGYTSVPPQPEIGVLIPVLPEYGDFVNREAASAIAGAPPVGTSEWRSYWSKEDLDIVAAAVSGGGSVPTGLAEGITAPPEAWVDNPQSPEAEKWWQRAFKTLFETPLPGTLASAPPSGIMESIINLFRPSPAYAAPIMWTKPEEQERIIVYPVPGTIEYERYWNDIVLPGDVQTGSGKEPGDAWLQDGVIHWIGANGREYWRKSGTLYWMGSDSKTHSEDSSSGYPPTPGETGGVPSDEYKEFWNDVPT